MAEDNEDLLEQASAAFNRALAGPHPGESGAQVWQQPPSRTLLKQFLRVGSGCADIDSFRHEAGRFCSGFKAPSTLSDLDALYRSIKGASDAAAVTARAQDDSRQWRERRTSPAASEPRSSLSRSTATGADSGQGSQPSDFDSENLDRAFYQVEDDFGTPFLGSEERWKRREELLRQQGEQQGSRKRSLAARTREANFQRDQSAWEDSLMQRSGITGVREMDTESQLELEENVHVMVHNVRPAFLRQGDALFGLDNAPEAAAVVRDEKSDIAKAALRGSPAVIRLREQNLRTKMRHKFWELGGSRIGKIMGIAEGNEEADYGQADSARIEQDLDKLKSESAAAAVAREKGAGNSHAVSTGRAVGLSPREEIRRVRESLPVRAVRDELMTVIRNNQVVVIVGETGSGKTTQLTQYLREAGLTKGPSNQKLLVGCTQPRRVAAMSVAQRVADEVGCVLGTEVGYSIRFEDCTSDATEIKYLTDGILMRETLSSPDLDQYSCIVMDEAHERTLFTDVLFGVLKAIVARRLDFKLVVTSATMDADKFADFFGGAATFHIPGRTFKVEKFFTKSPVADYVDAAAKKALEIHLGQPEGDILIFMTGQEDITATCQLIAEKVEALGDGVPQLLLLPMYSQLPSDLQSRIFEKAKPGQRKCIVSTNIAETSLTVDGIRYVVDSGFCKLKVFNPRIGMDSLRITPVSQANANQRAGRAGRTCEGYCWHMFSTNQFVRELLPAQVPEIQRTNLGNVVLLLKSIGIGDLLSFDFMDPPPRENIINSMYQLWVLGALDDRGDLTEMGMSMSRYPLDPPLAKMLITAGQLGCTADTLTVVSMLSVPDVFYRPAERAEESDQARERFFVPESDHLTLLNVYNQVLKHKFSPGWCAKHFVHVKALVKARDVREQLQSMVSRALAEEEARAARTDGLAAGRTSAWDLVRKAICSAYFVHAAKLRNITQYVNLLNGTPANLHPSSAICGIGETPHYVVYHELVLTSKEYMRTVTAIDPQWLAELGPMFFSIKGASASLAAHQRAVRSQAGAAAQDQQDSFGGLGEAPSRAPARPGANQGLGFSKGKKKRRRGL